MGVWDVAEVDALPAMEIHPTTLRDRRARRRLRQQTQHHTADQISALRAEGKTWSEVAQAMGRSHSGVRAIHEQPIGGAEGERLNDEAILANLRAFMAERGDGRVSRRAYQAWPEKAVAAATVENRFGSWAQAVTQAWQVNV